MKTSASKTILLILFIFSSSLLFSQANQDTLSKPQKVIVKMKNGDEFKGELMKRDENIITLKTENGELNLIVSNVVSLENDVYDGKFRFSNPHDTRYFFGPTGIPVKKNKGYYQNVLLSTNFVNYGITENVSIGGGFEFISTLAGYPIWFLTPKVGFNISTKTHVAAGVIMAGFAAEGTATLTYGVFTRGTSESNVSLGIGYGLMSGEFSKYPAIMFSGTHRVGNNVALLSENYIITNRYNETNYIGIQGIRILSPKNSFDIGAIIIPSIIDFVPALPFVGYSRAF